MKIRPIDSADYPAVRELWLASGLGDRLHGRLGVRDSEAEFVKQLEHFPRTYLLAEDDGRVVGVVLGTHDQRKGWINRLAVHPDCRRWGIGRKLVEACEQALFAEGLGIVSALVEKDNSASAELFADAGYAADVPVQYFRKKTRPDI